MGRALRVRAVAIVASVGVAIAITIAVAVATVMLTSAIAVATLATTPAVAVTIATIRTAVALAVVAAEEAATQAAVEGGVRGAKSIVFISLSRIAVRVSIFVTLGCMTRGETLHSSLSRRVVSETGETTANRHCTPSHHRFVL